MINFFIVAYHFILHIHVKNVHHRYICKLFATFCNVSLVSWHLLTHYECMFA